MKKTLLLVAVLVVLISVGYIYQSSKKVGTPIISSNIDSEYANTFKGLNLGILFDYEFYLPNADKSWVNLWVERYYEGKKDPHPIAQLSYGYSPVEVKEGPLGFGIINPKADNTLIFLYGPGVNSQPTTIERLGNHFASSWGYAIGNEKVKLELGETKLLAVYRESENGVFRTYDLQNEEDLMRLIEEDSMVLLLKIKVDERIDN